MNIKKYANTQSWNSQCTVKIASRCHQVMRRKEKEKIQQITAFSNTAIGQTFWFLLLLE